jgi:cell wall-associated NlpC family hydrolase
MPSARRTRIAVLGVILGVACAGLGTGLTASSAHDLQGQIAAAQSAAASMRSAIAADTTRIHQTAGGLAVADRRLGILQGQLNVREAELATVQRELIAARDHLVDLENRLERATRALSANLVAAYEQGQPNLVTVILEARGFTDLVEQVDFLHRMGVHDAQIVGTTRAARRAVAREAAQLASLELRDRLLASRVLTARNQVAALQAALLHEQIAALHSRNAQRTKLYALDRRLGALEAKAAAQAAAAAASGNAAVGGIAVDTGGMVQPPPGAPAAVAQVMAAGNAIATLPYIYGGGHGSFRADGYDCSGSVSYALAAAGLVTSPMVSGDFEDWGDPGPGRWITIYANAGHVWMEVAGWRFDTVALAEGGTRWARGGGEFSGFVVRHPPGL